MHLLKEYGIVEDPRFRQARKEAWGVFILVLIETIWVFGFAIWGTRSDPSEYTYFMGIPLWLLWAFIGAGVVFPILAALYALAIKDCEITADGRPEE